MTCLVLPMQHLQPDVPIGARVQAPSTAVPTMLAPNGASKPDVGVGVGCFLQRIPSRSFAVPTM